MEKLFLDYSKLLELQVMQSVLLDGYLQDLAYLDEQNATEEEKYLVQQVVYKLVASRSRLKVQILSRYQELIIAFNKSLEISILDFAEKRKIEIFTGR